MKWFKLFFLTLCAMLPATAALAQSGGLIVSGIISDPSNGEPIPYATVLVKGTSHGVSANGEGLYTIDVPAGGTLVFSAMGFKNQEITPGEKGRLDVSLEIDFEALEKSVVVGYGTKKSISSLVGSVKVVEAATLNNAPSSTALDNLQGKVSGLSVATNSGLAGDDSVVMTLHGVGSITASSTPLYIIDGVPSSSRTIMAMNPNDIETISVLKDASATSIYGSRAANGVIYVTTKSGGFNEKATITVRAQYGTSTLANTRFYEDLMSGDELAYFWEKSGIHTADWIKTNFTDQGYTANTKWWKYFMNLWTPQYQADLTVSGGSGKVAYLVSASQFHQDGFAIGNYYDRYTVRGNIQAHPVSWFKIGLNFNASLDKSESNDYWSSSTENSANSAGGQAYLLNPMYPLDGENPDYYIESLGMANPYYFADNYSDATLRATLNGLVSVDICPVKNLTISSRLGIDAYIAPTTSTLPYTIAANIGDVPFRSRSDVYDYTATITNTVEYLWDLNYNNKFTFLVGHEGITSHMDMNYSSSNGQTDDRMMFLQQGSQSTYTMLESISEYKFLSFFAHVDYTLKNKYFFDAVVRNDASSRFGAKNRNALFWSLGAKWNLKREPWLLNSRPLNALDIKASYGTQGNAEIGNYASLGIISSNGSYHDTAARILSQPANDALTWEKQSLLTVGVSTRLWDTLDIEAEAYDRRTTSMLLDVPNPYTTGFSSVTGNVGTLKNTGVDVTIGVDILNEEDYYLRFSTVFSYNVDKITKLFNNLDRWEVTGSAMAYVVGQPIMYYYPIYAGIDPTDGQPMWYLPGDDVDVTTKDPTRTTKTFDAASLTQNTGKRRYAPVNGGFTLSGGWKGISVRADFNYVLGKWMINNDAYFYANPYLFPTDNANKTVTDFWTPTNPNAKWPAWGTGAVMQEDTHLLENSSFMRLRNLQVAYDFPQKLLNWSGGVLKGIKITFTGRNLFVVTGYTGNDPELSFEMVEGIAGNTKQFLGGLELTF